MSVGKFGINPVRGNRNSGYLLEFSVTTKNTAAPTVDPNYGDDAKVVRTNTGLFTLTFPESKKPHIVKAWAQVQGDEPTLKVQIVSYVQATGILTFKVYALSGGSYSAADTTDKVVLLVLKCTDRTEGLG